MEAPDPKQPGVRSCPECGAAVATGQRRCTNCGTPVDARRRLPRRTPLVAAIVVAGLSGVGVVVAQAAVTEKASIDASAPADVASAPVSVSGPELPAAKGATSTAPKTPPPATTPTDAQSTSPLEIPSLAADLLKQAQEARDKADAQAKKDKAAATSPDGTPTKDDTPADPDDLQDAKKLKVTHTANYNPGNRVGVEFGTPKAAVDKRSRTVWDVNIPADGQPFNVGIILSLGQVRRVSSLKIGTPTPNFGLQIYRSDADTVPDTLDAWKLAADVPSVSDDVTVPLSDDGDKKWAKYILVYLTTTRSADDTRAALSNLEVLP